jgi:DNA-binding MarR family transcriptional regulator
MQEDSIAVEGRLALLEALEGEIRLTSGLGVLFSQAIAARLGLTPTELECLDQILLGEDVTAGALAKSTGLTTGAITGIVDRLERAGYARRERDPRDRRRVLVKVTPTARMRAMPFYRALQREMGRLLAEYRDDEIALLLGYFRRTRSVMQGEIAKLRSERPIPRPRPRRR